MVICEAEKQQATWEPKGRATRGGVQTQNTIFSAGESCAHLQKIFLKHWFPRRIYILDSADSLQFIQAGLPNLSITPYVDLHFRLVFPSEKHFRSKYNRSSQAGQWV